MTHLFGVHCQKISNSKIVPLWRDIRPFEKISCKTPLEIELVIYILECLINNSILCASWQKKYFSKMTHQQHYDSHTTYVPISWTCDTSIPFNKWGFMVKKSSCPPDPVIPAPAKSISTFEKAGKCNSFNLGGLCHISLSMHSIKV